MEPLPYKWIIDLSHHNNLRRAQMTQLVEKGMCGIIAKACSGDYSVDGMVDEHLGNAVHLGIPYGIYHWPDPILGIKSIPSQLEHLGKQIERLRPRFVAWDAEQWWANWTEWHARYVKKQNVHVRALSSSHLLTFYTAYNHELKRQLDQKHGGIPSMAYSAQWFTRGYCRKLADIFRDHSPFYWTAYYFGWKDFDNDKAMNWAEWDHWMRNMVKPNPGGLPDGMTEWDVWQVGEVTVKGFPRLDYNIITDDAYAALFGGEVPVVQEPAPVVTEPAIPSEGTTFTVTATPFLNARSSPKVLKNNDIGDILTGTKLNILNIVGTNAWIEYEPGKFACVQLGTKRYMELTK
jgi:hypothetical protein